jgi:hypothetical protein
MRVFKIDKSTDGSTFSAANSFLKQIFKGHTKIAARYGGYSY